MAEPALPTTNTDWRRPVAIAAGLVTFTILVTTAYVGRTILIPIALGMLIAFILTPVVKWIERRGLGRTPAVLSAIGVAVILFGLVAWMVVWQMTALADDLPNYSASITTKIREGREQVLGGAEKGRFGTMLDAIDQAIDPDKAEQAAKEAERLKKKAEREAEKQKAKGKMGGGAGPAFRPEPKEAADPVAAEEPKVIEVKAAPGPVGFDWMGQVVNPAAELAGQFAFAFILAVFMLFKKEDLRNRVIRLVGEDERMMATTRAVDDASRRVSRYLFMQLLINTCYGVIVTIALALIGVNYFLLWGLLATVMRYVPYIGTWLGLIPPVITSFAMSEGWFQPIAVFAVYGALELFSNNVVEPRAYGTSTGLSEVAQLVATAFWALIWGPIGLILAAPMTVCMLVLGKYVPQLRFMEVVLGDEQVLAPPIRVYQRLISRDQDEALEVAEESVESSSLEATYDAVLLPALGMVAKAEQGRILTEAEAKSAYQSVREITDDLAEADWAARPAQDDTPAVRLYTVAARDEGDEVALGMLTGLLGTREWTVTVAGSGKLTSEVADEVGRLAPPVVLVGSVPPGGKAHIRYLCKRLRARCPETHIVVGYWGEIEGETQAGAGSEADIGADKVCTTIAATAQHLRSWRAVSDLSDKPADPRPASPAEIGTASAR